MKQTGDGSVRNIWVFNIHHAVLLEQRALGKESKPSLTPTPAISMPRSTLPKAAAFGSNREMGRRDCRIASPEFDELVLQERSKFEIGAVSSYAMGK